MYTKQLIWASLFLLLFCVPSLYSQDDEAETPSDPSELVGTDDQTTPTAYRGGWDTGYKNGYTAGKNDHDSGVEFHPKDAPEYKGYRSSYDSSMGKRSHYKEGYREGFRLGYQDGFSGVVSRLITPAAPEQAQVIEEESATAVVQEPPVQQSETIEPTPPRALPKTASALPLVGMIGLAGIALSFLFRALGKDAD